MLACRPVGLGNVIASGTKTGRAAKEEEAMALVNLTRGLATGVAAAAIMLCVQPASANENFGSLQGMVTSPGRACT